MEKRILLPAEERITQWYNVMPDMPGGMPPPLNPLTKQPLTPDLMAPIFPMGLLEQEMSDKRWIDIPEEIQDIWSIWRPSPLVR
ncbi:MAG: TrpB-like pyridoxal phosphate-dependent enzyme, partial [Desulfurivibrionaceae bacterium]